MFAFLPRCSVLARRASHVPRRGLRTPADRESLFNTTMFGYLYQDEKQRAMQRLEFDVDALASAASSTLGVECVEIQKLSESATSRTFTLTMDDGQELLARFPFASAGPRTRLVQSEAATLDLLGMHFGLPVPRVAGYNSSMSRFENNVGAPYILQSKIEGETTLSPEAIKSGAERFLTELVQTQGVLGAIPFSQHGSIYYTSDVDPSLRNRPLFREIQGFNPAEETLDRFRIGPSVARNFYRGKRATMDLDRGPWPDDISYFRALVDADIKWLELYGSSEEAHRSAWESSRSPDEHIELLRKWRTLAPELMMFRNTPRLGHPALQMSNIHLGGLQEDPDINGIVDWQGACVAPVSLQTSYPDMVDPRLWNEENKNENGETTNTMDPAIRTLVEKYLEKLFNDAPLVGAVQSSDILFLVQEASRAAAITWEAGTFGLQYSLYCLAQEWPAYRDQDRSAILGHSNIEELPPALGSVTEPSAASVALWQMRMALEGRLSIELAKHGILSNIDEGRIPADQALQARMISAKLYRDCMDKATADEAAIIKHAWPAREDRWTSFTESCE